MSIFARIIPILAALVLAMPSFAQTGAGGAFTLVNDTSDHILVGFYTSEDAENFSDNWLGEAMMPGESGTAEFFANEGSCIQYFVTGWLADDDVSEVFDEIIEIDICEASVVYLGDNEILFE